MTGRDYTVHDMAAVSDNPEWTAADFAQAKPFSEAFPDLAATIRRRGKQKAPTKRSTTIRLSPEVIEYFRGTGAGWQARIDQALKEWIAAR